MKKYSVRFITPYDVHFKGETYSLTVPTADGNYCVLADYEPSVIILSAGIVTINDGKGKERWVTTGGILDVKRDEAIVLTDFIYREKEAEKALNDRIEYNNSVKQRRKQSYFEYKLNTINLMKALHDLKS